MPEIAGNGPSHTERPRDDAWPPAFPHAVIDRLLDQLERGETLDPREARRALALVAREAQRLRATVARLSVEKLSEADREARDIVEEAARHADALRSIGRSVLDSRLEEADRLWAGTREALRVELRVADLLDRADDDRFGPVPRPGTRGFASDLGLDPDLHLDHDAAYDAAYGAERDDPEDPPEGGEQR